MTQSVCPFVSQSRNSGVGEGACAPHFSGRGQSSLTFMLFVTSHTMNTVTNGSQTRPETTALPVEKSLEQSTRRLGQL